MTDAERARAYIRARACPAESDEFELRLPSRPDWSAEIDDLAAEFAAIRREAEAQQACDVKVLQAADAWAEERTFASVAALVAAVKARKEARTT